MDSCKFSAECMSQPLNCPIGRLSSAKSTSSIDQCACHNDNGDSVCSTFSGGSSAPEYGSLYFPSGLHCDTFPVPDIKCTGVKENPCVVHSSPSTSVVHWYRSAEGAAESRGRDLDQKNFDWEPPPPPPARLDSFIAVRNLENSSGPPNTKDHPRRELIRCLWPSQSNPRNQAECKRLSEELQSGNHLQRAQNIISSHIQYRMTNRLDGLDCPSHVNSLTEREKVSIIKDDPKDLQYWCRKVQSDQHSNRRNEEDRKNPYGSPCMSHLFNIFQGNQKIEHKDDRFTSFRHHNSCHHIFYSGPEKGVPALNFNKKERASSLHCLDHANCRTDCGGIVNSQPVVKMAADDINQETTPLQYHLAGDSGGTLRTKSNGDNETTVTLKEIRPDNSSTRPQGINTSDSCIECGSRGGRARGSLQLMVDIQGVGPAGEFPGAARAYCCDSACVPLNVTQVPQEVSSLVSFSEYYGGQGKENFPQLQVARDGNQEILSPEQRTLCSSDPESLNRLVDGAACSICSSLDRRVEDPLCIDDLSKKGLVAARRKAFETKGRALSAFCFSKTTLKHIQHEALQAYMERKVSHRTVDAQWMATQCPDKRHSMAGRLVENGRRTDLRKNLSRPLSAGRLLDSSHSDFSRLPSDEERTGPTTEKSASTDDLLKQGTLPDFCQSHSTPSPYTLQTTMHNSRALPASKRTFGSQETAAASQWAMQESGRICKEAAGPGESVEKLRGRRMARAHEQKSAPSFYEGKSRCWGLECRRPLFKQESAPQLHVDEACSQDGAHSKPWAIPKPSSRGGPALGGTGSPSSLPAYGLDCPKWELNRVKSSSKSGSSPRPKMSPVQPSQLELSVDDPEEIFGSFPEVLLSQRVTTDLDSWLRSREGERPLLPSVGALQGTSNTQDHDQENDWNTRGEPSEREEDEEEEGVSVDEPEFSPGPTRETEVKSQWEGLVGQVVAEDQSLAHILLPATSRISAVTLMEQLLSEDTFLMEDHYRRRAQRTEDGSAALDDLVAVVYSSNAAHPSTEDQTHETSQTQGWTRSEVTEKKKLLASCIERHLEALEERWAGVGRELRAHMERADAVAGLVRETCLPLEYERYAQFMDDLERVVSLLLCLSARLARVQNMMGISDLHMDPEEKESLQNRHRLLCKQRDDAKGLKENLERRERVVAGILARHLTAEQLDEYKRLVQTKASLLILQKDLDERRRLGKEQLQALLGSVFPQASGSSFRLTPLATGLV